MNASVSLHQKVTTSLVRAFYETIAKVFDHIRWLFWGVQEGTDVWRSLQFYKMLTSQENNFVKDKGLSVVDVLDMSERRTVTMVREDVYDELVSWGFWQQAEVCGQKFSEDFLPFLLSVTWKMFSSLYLCSLSSLSTYTPIVIFFWSRNGLLHLSKPLVCTSRYTRDTTDLLSGFHLRPQRTQVKSWTVCEFMCMIQVCTSLWGKLDFRLLQRWWRLPPTASYKWREKYIKKCCI